MLQDYCACNQCASTRPATQGDADPFREVRSKARQAVGRSPYLQPVHVEDAALLIGKIRLSVSTPHDQRLKGSLVGSPNRRAEVLAH